MTIGIDMRPLLAGPATGVGIHLRGLVQGLSELQREGTLQDTYVLCSTGFKKSSAVLDTVCIDSPFQRRHISIPNKILTLSWLLTRLPTMRQLFPEIDYWLLPNITLYPYGPSTRYAVLVHDLSFIHYGRWYSMKRRLWHYATKFRKLLSHAELLITVSQTTASILKELIPESLYLRRRLL
jgi:hypothetical protein